MFKDVYSKITVGNQRWNELVAPKTLLYPWDDKSTYIKSPPFLENMVCVCVCACVRVCVCVCVCLFTVLLFSQTKELPPVLSIKNATVLLLLGDSVTTDHISPAGNIARNSPAARYLASRG